MSLYILTVEPRYNKDSWDHENDLLSGFFLSISGWGSTVL